jgi:hypothetical protein
MRASAITRAAGGCRDHAGTLVGWPPRAGTAHQRLAAYSGGQCAGELDSDVTLGQHEAGIGG